MQAEMVTLSAERRELLCSVIGLTVKLGLVLVGAVSLCRLAGAYQQRMERQGEITAVLELHSGEILYWALNHPGEQADFHLREGFALRV